MDFECVSQDEVANASPIFITGVGRSGTHFLAKLFEQENQINAYHLDEVGNAVADSFLMYAKWHNLHIDYEGFFRSRNFLIHSAQRRGKVYLESNPYLVLFAKELLEYYPKARIIHVVRNARDVVLSHLNKGWYENYSPAIGGDGKAPFYQYQIKQANHFFGRIFPVKSEEFELWSKMTQVGKISWMWATLNNYLADSLKVDQRRINLFIDQFDHNAYLSLGSSLGLKIDLTAEGFTEIKADKPGKTQFKKVAGWDIREEQGFLKEVEKFSLLIIK